MYRINNKRVEDGHQVFLTGNFRIHFSQYEMSRMTEMLEALFDEKVTRPSEEDQRSFKALQTLSKIARHRESSRFEAASALMMAANTFADHWPEHWEGRDKELAYCQAAAHAATNILSATMPSSVAFSIERTLLVKPSTGSKITRFSTMILMAVAQEQVLILVIKDWKKASQPSPKADYGSPAAEPDSGVEDGGSKEELVEC